MRDYSNDWARGKAERTPGVHSPLHTLSRKVDLRGFPRTTRSGAPSPSPGLALGVVPPAWQHRPHPHQPPRHQAAKHGGGVSSAQPAGTEPEDQKSWDYYTRGAQEPSRTCRRAAASPLHSIHASGRNAFWPRPPTHPAQPTRLSGDEYFRGLHPAAPIKGERRAGAGARLRVPEGPGRISGRPPEVFHFFGWMVLVPNFLI